MYLPGRRVAGEPDVNGLWLWGRPERFRLWELMVEGFGGEVVEEVRGLELRRESFAFTLSNIFVEEDLEDMVGDMWR